MELSEARTVTTPQMSEKDNRRSVEIHGPYGTVHSDHRCYVTLEVWGRPPRALNEVHLTPAKAREVADALMAHAKSAERANRKAARLPWVRKLRALASARAGERDA